MEIEVLNIELQLASQKGYARRLRLAREASEDWAVQGEIEAERLNEEFFERGCRSVAAADAEAAYEEMMERRGGRCW